MTIRPDPSDRNVVIAESGHAYPVHHAPGMHWATDKAWDILDFFAPDVFPRDVRFLLAGCIAGALLRAASEHTPKDRRDG